MRCFPNPDAPYAALVEMADEALHGTMLHGTRASARNHGCPCGLCRAWERGHAAATYERSKARSVAA